MTADTPITCAPSVETPAMTDAPAPAPTGDMVLAADASPRDPRIKVIADAMSAKRQDLIAQPLSFIWEALAEAALTAAPSPSASTMGAAEAHAVIREIAEYAENVAFAAGVGSLETAGQLVSFLWERPSLMADFMAGKLDAVDTGALDHHNGVLSWHGMDGGIHRPDPAKARFKAPAPEPLPPRGSIQSCLSSAGGEGPVEALREALAPFAREADEWADTVPDDYRSLCTEPGSETALPGSETAYTVGDLRRARSVYNASLSPPKAETETDTITNATVADIMAGIEVPAETASERERLVEALRSAVAQIEALCGPLDVPDDARAALAQEPAR